MTDATWSYVCLCDDSAALCSGLVSVCVHLNQIVFVYASLPGSF